MKIEVRNVCFEKFNSDNYEKGHIFYWCEEVFLITTHWEDEEVEVFCFDDNTFRTFTADDDGDYIKLDPTKLTLKG